MDISSMLEVQVNEVKEADSKENVTPRDLAPSTPNLPPPISQEESNYYKIVLGNDVSSVRFRKLHCTACDVHIGSAPSQADNMFEHPVLRTLLCAKCFEFYGDGTFEQGDDATDMFCRWCANGGHLYCCSYCSNTFCSKCIKRNFDPVIRKKIKTEEKWKCLVCDPTDLYTARALCWALLQHVQTVKRILQNDTRMSSEEIEEKLNLDESQCCPRREKRKRHRSNSDEEDFLPSNFFRKPPKKKYCRKPQKPLRTPGSPHSGTSYVHNRAPPRLTPTRPIPIRPRLPVGGQTDIPPPLFSCEQSMTTCENVSINPNGIVVSSIPRNATIVNPVASASYLQSPVTPTHQIVFSTSQINSYQPRHSAPPMVAIPNQNSNLLQARRVALSKPKRSSTATITPNIIDLDSDSDEPATTDSSSNMVVDDAVEVNVSASPVTAVPVALVRTESSIEKQDNREQHLQEIPAKIERPTKPFNQIMQPYTVEIESILRTLKIRFHKLFEDPKQGTFKEAEFKEVKKTVKQFYREIRNTISDLVCINDRVVREFNKWKRCRRPQDHVDASNNSIKTTIKASEIPLDMVCVNESGGESEDEAECTIISPSDLTNSIRYKECAYVKRKETSDRAVGNHILSCESKAIQVNSIVSKECEKCIAHSLLGKTVKEQTTTRYSVISNDYPNKYQEQFLRYVENIEYQDVETEAESARGLPDPNETPLKDLIEANSPFISEMLENMETSYEQQKYDEQENTANRAIRTEKDLVSEKSETSTVTCKAVEELVKMVSKLNNDLSENVKEKLHIQCSEEKVQEDERNAKNQISIGIKKNNSNKNNHDVIDTTVCSEIGEDCTIIED